MKVVVPIKIAGSLDDHSTSRDGRIHREALEWDINEWDMFSLEAALQVLESADGGELVVVTVGGDEAEDGLLTALAMGADRSIHVAVDQDRLALDAMSVARLLRAVVEPEAPDLVLCGVQSSDSASAATGVALAGLLDVPRVAVVRSIAIDEGSATVHRELEGGVAEELEVPLPAVLTVQTGINEPRYATLRGIRQAKEKPQAVVEPAELGFSEADLISSSGSRRHSLEPVARDARAEMLEGDAEAIASQIAAIVRSKVSA